MSFKFKDLEDFIYNYEQMNQNIDNEDKKGISLMTVHKAKGLQFHSVIIVDQNKTANRPAILSFDHDDEGQLQHIFYNKKEREHFDSEYAKMVQKQDIKSQEDAINKLYVAMTRAEKNLTIIQLDNKSYLKHYLNLKPCNIGSMAFTTNQEQIKNLKTPKFQELDYGRQDIKGEQNIEIDYEAIYFGNIMHFCLEHITNFSLEHIKPVLGLAGFHFKLNSIDLQHIKTLLQQIINNQEFQNLIKGQIYKEQQVLYQGKLQRIDLLIFTQNEIRIIDYKTGLANSAYKKQLDNYKTALASLYPNQEIKTYLYYLQLGQLQAV